MKNKIKIFIYSSKNAKSGSKPAAISKCLDIKGFICGTFAAGSPAKGALNNKNVLYIYKDELK